MHDNHQDIQSIQIIKRNGGKVFLYVNSNLSKENIIRYLGSVIQRKYHGALVYEFYGIYNDKIDFYPYLSNESKDKMKYYQTNMKDITKRDIDIYMAKL